MSDLTSHPSSYERRSFIERLGEWGETRVVAWTPPDRSSPQASWRRACLHAVPVAGIVTVAGLAVGSGDHLAATVATVVAGAAAWSVLLRVPASVLLRWGTNSSLSKSGAPLAVFGDAARVFVDPASNPTEWAVRSRRLGQAALVSAIVWWGLGAVVWALLADPLPWYWQTVTAGALMVSVLPVLVLCAAYVEAQVLPFCMELVTVEGRSWFCKDVFGHAGDHRSLCLEDTGKRVWLKLFRPTLCVLLAPHHGDHATPCRARLVAGRCRRGVRHHGDHGHAYDGQRV